MKGVEILHMLKIKRKLLILPLIILFAVSAISAYAVFSDKELNLTVGKVGTVKVAQENLQIQTQDGTQNYGQALSNWNPGDVNRIRWDVINQGNKSIDTRNTVYLYWDVQDDIREYGTRGGTSAIPGTMYLYPAFHANGSEYTDAQIAADILAGAPNALVQDDMTEISAEGGTRYGYRYTFTGDTLAGVGSGAETQAHDSSEPGGAQPDDDSRTQDHLELKIAFDPRVSVNLMGVPFQIDVVTEAKQHRNTNDDDWAVIS